MLRFIVRAATYVAYTIVEKLIKLQPKVLQGSILSSNFQGIVENHGEFSDQ
jgi:hypothetical protein